MIDASILGAMLGNEDDASVMAYRNALGKEIQHLTLSEERHNRYYMHDVLHFVFTDGSYLKVFDACYHGAVDRYMRTDDSLEDVIGGMLEEIEVRDATPQVNEEDAPAHEIQFLVVKTSKGYVTLSSHNEHNGYYGGFSIIFQAGH